MATAHPNIGITVGVTVLKDQELYIINQTWIFEKAVRSLFADQVAHNKKQDIISFAKMLKRSQKIFASSQ